MQSVNYEVVAAAVAALGKMGSIGLSYAPEISSFLRHDAPEVQIAAATALGLFGKEASAYGAELLSLSSDSQEESVKIAALVAAGRVGDKGSKDLISKCSDLLNGSSPRLAAAACQALGQVGDETKAAAIAAKLQDPHTRYAALQGLCDLDGRVVCDFATEVISLCLTDQDGATRQLAVAAIGRQDSDGKSFVLAGKKVSEVVDQLQKLIEHQDSGVRCAAAQALGHLGSEAEPHIACLEPLLADESEDTSCRSLQIGGGGQRAPPAFRKPVCAALSAFGMTGAQRYAEDIVRKLRDDDWEVRLSALEALGSLGEAGLEEAENIATALEDDVYMVRAKACDVIAKIQALEQAESVKATLKDKAPSVRVAAVRALGALGESGAAYSNEVFKLLSDSALAVRVAAIQSLGCMGEIGQCYASVIAAQLNDAQAEVRLASVEVLGRLGDHGAAFAEEVAMCMEDDPSPLVRKAAMGSLAQMGDQAYLAIAA